MKLIFILFISNSTSLWIDKGQSYETIQIEVEMLKKCWLNIKYYYVQIKIKRGSNLYVIVLFVSFNFFHIGTYISIIKSVFVWS